MSLITVLFALAAMRVALVIVAVIAVLALAICIIMRPRETLVFVGMFLLSSLAYERPGISIAVIGTVSLASLALRWRRQPEPRQAAMISRARAGLRN